MQQLFHRRNIPMSRLLFVQHMQQMRHRCWSADMGKVRRIRGCEGMDLLADSMTSVTLRPAETQTTTSAWHWPHTDWLVSVAGEISLCHRPAHHANTGPLTALFFSPHSIKMQSVWLIVVSCALRRDHHQLFRPFTWCWSTITMKVTKVPIFPRVYSCCTHGQVEKFKSDHMYASNLSLYCFSNLIFSILASITPL